MGGEVIHIKWLIIQTNKEKDSPKTQKKNLSDTGSSADLVIKYLCINLQDTNRNKKKSHSRAII